MANLEELKLFASYAGRFYWDNGPGLPEEDEGDEDEEKQEKEEEEEKLRKPTSPC
ncbi:MAG: hypothetical protein WBO19_16340 [Terriglobia bacterium]